MSTGNFAATEGSGKNAATWTFTEDAITKFLQRVGLCDANGLDIAGSQGDPAWTSGSGTILTLLKAIATSATDANPAPVRLATDLIANGTSTLTPKFASIAASSSGDNVIVAAVTSKKIRVLAFALMANGAVNAKWRSSTTSDKSGLFYFAAAGAGIAPPFCPVGLFETVAGEALELNLSGAVAVGGFVVYVEV